MNKLFPMLMLFVGVGLAAAFGARNGGSHIDNRQALWAVSEASAGIARAADIEAKQVALGKLQGDDLTEARAELGKAREAHTKRTEALKESGFLGITPIDAQMLKARELPLQVYREVLGDEPIDEIIERMNMFSLGAAKNQLQGHQGDALDDETKASLEAAIDAAIAGGSVAPAVFQLRAAGIDMAPPEPDQIRKDLIATSQPTELLGKLVEAGHIDTVQSYEDRLAEAQSAAKTSSVPPPSTRISEWSATGGPIWFIGAALIAAGAVIARRQIAAENAGEGGTEGDSTKVDFQVTLDQALARIDALANSISDLRMDVDAPEARDEIDKIQLELMQPVVEQRGRFMARHGLAVFAEYFSPFAATERNLARAWSALTDGHAVVARDAVERARDSLGMADEAWKRAEAQRVK